jgi:hypothetical protein
MANESVLIHQMECSNSYEFKLKLQLEYRNEWLSKGFESGWNKCSETFKKSHDKIKRGIIEKKNQLLDELHQEIWDKKGHGENNIQD